jgi:hypothetical protein
MRELIKDHVVPRVILEQIRVWQILLQKSVETGREA